MADISKITLPSGTTYDLKDATARQSISDIQTAMSGGVSFLGETTTALTDQATTTTIKINGSNVTAKAGNLVYYGKKEFLFNGTKWIEMGDLTTLKALAYKDSASGKVTAAGSVSQPTFTGTEFTSTGKFTPAGSVDITVVTDDVNTDGPYKTEGILYEPTGSVDLEIRGADDRGLNVTSSGSFKPEGSVTISTGTGTKNYTPEGSVSQPTFSGDEMTSAGTCTPNGSVTISKGTGTANYTPEGSVSKPNITVTPSTTTVNSITNVGTLPSLTTTVSGETLTIGFSQGTLPTKGSNTTVMTGASAALAEAPSFTGTGVQLKGTFSGSSTSVSVKGTPTGTVSKPTFTGTGTQLKASFSGTSKTVSVSTKLGAIFEGDAIALRPSFSGTEGNISVKGTATGNVSKPTFTGSEVNVTVS